MWEVTLIGKPNDLIFFLDLKNELKSKLGNDVLVVITFDKALVISIALKSNSFRNFVKDSIFFTIIKCVKFEFYAENLITIDNERTLNTYLVSNLTSMGILEESHYACKKIKLSKTIVIRSLVYFQLQNLLEHWRKDVVYFNMYFRDNSNNKYIDYLKILASTSQNKIDILYLVEKNNEMQLMDSNNKKLKSINKHNEVDLISSLIMFAPKKIIINCIDNMSEKITNIISYIFEDRVSVIL